MSTISPDLVVDSGLGCVTFFVALLYTFPCETPAVECRAGAKAWCRHKATFAPSVKVAVRRRSALTPVPRMMFRRETKIEVLIAAPCEPRLWRAALYKKAAVRFRVAFKHLQSKVPGKL